MVYDICCFKYVWTQKQIHIYVFVLPHGRAVSNVKAHNPSSGSGTRCSFVVIPAEGITTELHLLPLPEVVLCALMFDTVLPWGKTNT